MERLQKYLARSGVASRRRAETLIKSGLVAVNGQVITELGVKVEPGRDRVTVAGQEVSPAAERIYLMLNKPQGYITSNRDPHGRQTVMDLLPAGFSRVFPVGRLDYDTTGLLLLTNDGELAFALTHPSHEVLKIYQAQVQGVPDRVALQKLRTGVWLEDGLTLPAEVDIIEAKAGNAMLRIGLREGRKRQVRRMCQVVGHPVLELTRVALGPLELGALPLGEYRRLTAEEIKALEEVAQPVRKREQGKGEG